MTIRQSGHLIDSTLQTDEQNLFESLSSETKEKVATFKLSRAFGIKLTPSEDKIITALCKILHDKSENKDIDSEQFYSGNGTSLYVPYGNDDEVRSAVIRLKPAELYKEYHGNSDYTGKDILNIQNILHGLSEKKLLIQYNRQRKVKKGKTEEILTDRIEDVQSLIKIMPYIEGMTPQEVKILDSGDTNFRQLREELIIALNPLITDQIKSKYVEYPDDIIQRTMIASGGASKVTKSIITLRDYLMREISNKRYNPEIDEETLIDQTRLRDIAKSGRRKRLHQRISEAIEANKKLGLILESKIDTGSKGQVKHIFTLNKNFE